MRTLVFTDISKDGTLAGPNLGQLEALSRAVSCNVVASGGMRELADITALKAMGLYGAICGKSLYSGTLDLAAAIREGAVPSDRMGLERFFKKSPLIPCVVQEASTGDVLMLAYMNQGALAAPSRRAPPGSGADPAGNIGTKGPPAAMCSGWWPWPETATTTPCW